MFFWVKDDAGVATPNDEVTGLGFVHAREIDAADVEIARRDVLVGEASLFVDVVNEVGTVRFGIGIGVHGGNGGQNVAGFGFCDGTWSGRMRRAWRGILAENRRSHCEAQRCENEAMSHALSLADRGES